MEWERTAWPLEVKVISSCEVLQLEKKKKSEDSKQWLVYLETFW